MRISLFLESTGGNIEDDDGDIAFLAEHKVPARALSMSQEGRVRDAGRDKTKELAMAGATGRRQRMRGASDGECEELATASATSWPRLVQRAGDGHMR
jgi:hypothetical protein